MTCKAAEGLVGSRTRQPAVDTRHEAIVAQDVAQGKRGVYLPCLPLQTILVFVLGLQDRRADHVLAMNTQLLGKQVWVTAAAGVPRNVVNATGVVEAITGSGRAMVTFHEDDEIRRRLNVKAVYIAVQALTTINPFTR